MPHKEEEISEFTPDLYPPFPEDVPTVELQSISLLKILEGDTVERDRVYEACVDRGFFYLELNGSETGETILRGADQIASTGERVFKLPLEEKMRYKMVKTLFGYKFAGATVTDKSGTPDTAEFFNVGKNDIIVPDDRMVRPWPSAILDVKPLFDAYMKSAHSVGMTVLAIIADKLGVEFSEFTSRHRIEEPSGDHVRITRGPPRDTEEMPEIQTPSHTDFGTITILMNWLGGLQVWSESSRKAQLNGLEPDVPGEWLWVKPKKGCAIINLGDAAVRFTNGVVCSGRHRVIPSPGAQGRWPRYSIVYFVRPEDKCLMKSLKGNGIPESREDEDEGLTATEWIYRKSVALGNRFDN
ncbi:putative oxidoreductase [Annulohypoxylon truncatum]|uniref:putative oxidoreductase n=1 Tax=Annulohypoxylon truncatum TaxID=327061 RepID=UPI00200892D9|nr:putative oxidoreductase [Annulohypoxylon truncatum]KAI1206065.1 putative oxidoreductase [Annulohypoxylon truncatum]